MNIYFKAVKTDADGGSLVDYTSDPVAHTLYHLENGWTTEQIVYLPLIKEQ